ncbi:MAG: DUF350 domain-containing protein [Thermodesulfobacteriota bacterium]
MDLKILVFDNFSKAFAFIVMYAVLFLLAKWLKDLFTPYKINKELTQTDNLAVALTMSGYYLATAVIFFGALFGPSKGFSEDLLAVGGYSLLGLVVLNLSRWFNDKIILRKFCNIEQLSKDHNIGVGAVQFGTYLATGLIAGGAVSGEGGGIVSFLVFFVLGQISLFVFSYIYDLLMPYCIHEELDKKNTAAGVAFGGTLIAIGIIILNGVVGDFVNWRNDLTLFGLANILAFIFLPLVRVFMDKLVIPGDDLSREIKEDQNVGAGLLEATVAICFAIVLTQLI